MDTARVERRRRATRRTSRRTACEIAVPPDNPAKITSVADLAKPGVKVAVCQAQVPCGKVATEVFANAHITVKPATEEVDVKSVLTKVTLGEVDAGIVYVTDVKAAGAKVKGIEIPADAELHDDATRSPPSRAPSTPRQAGEFVDLVLSGAGAEGAQEAGFAAARDEPARMTDEPPARRPWPLGVPAAGRCAAARRTPGRACSSGPRGTGLGPGSSATHRGRSTRCGSRCSRPRWRCWSRWCSACRWPGCWRARRLPGVRLLRALVTLPLVLPPVVGGVALLLVARPQRAASASGSTAGSGSRSRSPRRGRGRRRDVRGDAVPGGRRRGCLPLRGPGVRRGRGDPGSRTADSLPPGDAAADPARAGRRLGALLGARARRVRRDRSPSPATSRASPRRCRWRSTWRWRPTRTPRSRCRWCCSPSRSRCSSRCAAAGSGAGAA